MAYDERLAERPRTIVGRRGGASERKMFGGIAFMVDGKMCYGVLRDRPVVRLGPESAKKALEKPHTRPMDFTGRLIKSMLYVEAKGIRSDAALRSWLR